MKVLLYQLGKPLEVNVRSYPNGVTRGHGDPLRVLDILRLILEARDWQIWWNTERKATGKFDDLLDDDTMLFIKDRANNIIVHVLDGENYRNPNANGTTFASGDRARITLNADPLYGRQPPSYGRTFQDNVWHEFGHGTSLKTTLGIYGQTQEKFDLASEKAVVPSVRKINSIIREGIYKGGNNSYENSAAEIKARLDSMRKAAKMDPTRTDYKYKDMKPYLRQYGLDYGKEKSELLMNTVALNHSTNSRGLYAKKGVRLIPKALGGTKAKKVNWELVRKSPEYKKFNWKMNPKNLSIILDSLTNRGADRVEQIAVFSQVIPENGGNTTPHGNGAYGLVGWRGSRAKGLSSGISGLAHKLMKEIYSNPKATDWSHGGEGMGILSGKEMYEFFKKTPVTRKAVNAFMRGYVRPPLDLYLTRLDFAKFLEKYF